MTTKDELVTNITSWLKIDKEIKTLQDELKKRKTIKKKLTESLVNIMKSNEIDCFDITEGKIIYNQTKVKTALSKKYLESCLHEFFKGDDNIVISDVTKFIMERREVKVNETIRHKPSNV